MGVNDDRTPIYLRDPNGQIMGRVVTLTIFNDGKLKIKGPSDREFMIHVLQKAIEAVRGVVPETTHNGIEIVPANVRIMGGPKG